MNHKTKIKTTQTTTKKEQDKKGEVDWRGKKRTKSFLGRGYFWLTKQEPRKDKGEADLSGEKRGKDPLFRGHFWIPASWRGVVKRRQTTPYVKIASNSPNQNQGKAREKRTTKTTSDTPALHSNSKGEESTNVAKRGQRSCFTKASPGERKIKKKSGAYFIFPHKDKTSCTTIVTTPTYTPKTKQSNSKLTHTFPFLQILRNQPAPSLSRLTKRRIPKTSRRSHSTSSRSWSRKNKNPIPEAELCTFDPADCRQDLSDQMRKALKSLKRLTMMGNKNIEYNRSDWSYGV